jgi:SAM-dependent methyltransferase
MKLQEQIKNYYFEHLDELSPDKRFHYATRLAAWEGEAISYDLLKSLQDYVMPADKPLDTVIGELLKQQPHKGINAYGARKPFFDKYSGLYGIHSALFRVRHLKAVYGVDTLPVLFARVGKRRLDELAGQLMSDPEALKNLSTYAINYLYLYKDILLDEKDYIDVKSIIALKDGYDLANPKHIQLLIYLYTHCVIGASNFYTQELPAARREDYADMIKILEPLVSERFDEINLDNKLEFLVCAQICGIGTNISERIYQECAQSLSPNGDFLIDTHNKNAQADRVTPDKSEHRNVLFIMSCSPYEPHSTLVQN